MGLGFYSDLSNEDLAFLSTLTPSRRQEIERYILLKHATLEELKSDPEIRDLALGLRQATVDTGEMDEILINTAGSGYRQVSPDDVLQTGNEKGKYKIAPAAPKDYSDEEQELLDLLSLQKEYDYQMSGERTPHNINNPLIKDLLVALDKVSTASQRTTGDGGIKNDEYRRTHPDLPPLTDEVAKEATAKFMTSNMVGSEIGEQPAGVVMKNGSRTSVPIEHTRVAFKNDPSRGRDVDNRDVGSTSKNSVLRNEEDQQRILELLYQGIVNKSETINQTYGVTAEQLMEEKGMSYKPGQKTWDPDQYSGIRKDSPGDNSNESRPMIIDSHGGDIIIGDKAAAEIRKSRIGRKR